MKKQWMAVALGAGLCQLAMADVKVTLQGQLAGGWKTIDCPATADVCADNPIPFDATPFTLTFTFQEGLSPGVAPSSMSIRPRTDPVTGLIYEDLRFTQNHASWRSSDLAVAQVPAVPSATWNPLEGAADATLLATTSASRTRSLTHWFRDFDGHSVTTTTFESWTLSSTLTWQGSDGSAFQSRISMSGSVRFPTDTANFDDLQSDAYFRNLLSTSIGCNYCMQLQLADAYLGADGSYSGVTAAGLARIVSVVDTAAAVPEPSTYALMLAGVSAIGFAARRRRGALAVTP